MLVETAILPIPDVVALPGMALQLHVFEPRFRQLVSDCLETGRAVGIALGRKIAGSGIASPSSHHVPRRKEAQTLDEMLNTNQDSYIPASVFGIGDLTVLANLVDGRYLVEVRIRHRARMGKYVQEVPYIIANVDILPSDNTRSSAASRLFDGLLMASDALLGDKARIFRQQLGHGVLADQKLDQIVYPILQWFQVGAAATQALFEDASDFDRGARLLGWMIRYIDMTNTGDMIAPQQRTIEDWQDGFKQHQKSEMGKIIPFERALRQKFGKRGGSSHTRHPE